jgi:hypothetical protein
MGLLYNRPIRYMISQSFKIYVNAFISDVVKIVGRMTMFLILRTEVNCSPQDLHTATHIHIPHSGSPPIQH